MSRTLLRLLAVAPALLLTAAMGPQDPLLALLVEQVDHATEALADSDTPPYLVAVEVVDMRSLRLSASRGAVTRMSERHTRQADIDVRVGDMTLDNTHRIRDAGWMSDEDRPSVILPLDGDPAGTRVVLWRELDEAWQGAARRLEKVRGNDAVKVEAEDDSPDFSPAQPVVSLAPAVPVDPESAVDLVAWSAALRRISEQMLEGRDVLDAGLDLTGEYQTRWLVTSEGTRIRDHRTTWRVSTWATVVAADGTELEVFDYADVRDPGSLPAVAALEAMARGVTERVEALRDAPVMEPWSGPTVLRGRAAGVFFHEVFGHRVEGHRMKDENEGQTFRDQVGVAILPPFLSVVDDPTLSTLAGVDLAGAYAFDAEGVPAQRVTLVDQGVFRGFLLSRSPVEGFPVSNGHGRRQPGNAVVSRQGNLIVSSTELLSEEALRSRLVDEARAQGKEFGLIVDDITGGFTLTGRVVPNAFNVRPVSMWRVYVDGRPDELVRGGDLIGTPLTTFARVVAAGGEVEVFNGSCGAESGWVPVSAASPALLVRELEVQRKEKGNDRPPLLPSPEGDGADRALGAPVVEGVPSGWGAAPEATPLGGLAPASGRRSGLRPPSTGVLGGGEPASPPAAPHPASLRGPGASTTPPPSPRQPPEGAPEAQ